MRYASRKFIIAMVALGAATWLCWYFRLTGGEWVTTALAVVGMYKLSNVMDGKPPGGAK